MRISSIAFSSPVFCHFTTNRGKKQQGHARHDQSHKNTPVSEFQIVKNAECGFFVKIMLAIFMQRIYIYFRKISATQTNIGLQDSARFHIETLLSPLKIPQGLRLILSRSPCGVPRKNRKGSSPSGGIFCYSPILRQVSPSTMRWGTRIFAAIRPGFSRWLMSWVAASWPRR